MGASGCIETARDCGFTGVLLKALDGTKWMSFYDGDQLAIGSTAEIARLRERCHNEGLDLYVWTNPLASSLELQAALTAEAANAADGLFLDVEPYAQFWGLQPAGLATWFLELIRTDAPDAWIGLQPDPRASALSGIRVNEWVPFVNGLAGQHYWSDFQTNPTIELGRAQALATAYGLPYYPTLPGNASAWPSDQTIGEFPGFILWRYGTTPRSRLDWLGRVSVTG